MKRMERKIIKIDESLCDGCGQCVDACAEGAIQLIDGKAKLVSEIYCDGLGACIGDCPQDALTIETRDAQAFDEQAVEKHLAGKEESDSKPDAQPEPCGCPGSALRMFQPKNETTQQANEQTPGTSMQSQLIHWPVQLKLVPPQAPFLKNSDLLVCADCVPFAVPDFHQRFLRGKALVVGCPKLDDLEYYRNKLKDILKEARPRSLTVIKMEVPCCYGIADSLIEARDQVLPEVPITVHTIGIRGDQIDKIVSSGRITKAVGEE